MDAAIKSMNMLQVTEMMTKFEQQFESLDVQSQFMEGAMNATTTMTTPEVDSIGYGLTYHSYTPTGPSGLADRAGCRREWVCLILYLSHLLTIAVYFHSIELNQGLQVPGGQLAAAASADSEQVIPIHVHSHDHSPLS